MPYRGGLRALPGVLLGAMAVAACLAAGPSAGAHDLWLEPSSFRPAADEPVAVRILVGHDPSAAEPLPYHPTWIERFVYSGPLAGAAEPRQREIRGVPGGEPAGYLRVPVPGLYALGLVSAATHHTLGAEAFRSYLAEEGLEEAARADAADVYADGTVDEEFARSVKTLLRIGGVAGGSGFDRALGLPLELVPLDDPFTTAARPLRLRVLLHGEPVAGVGVDLVRLGEGAVPASARLAISDADGLVRLDLPEHGRAEAPERYLASAVVLTSPGAGSAAEWRSLWTSLTWERAGER